MPAQKQYVLTIADAAAFIHVTRQTFYRLKELPGFPAKVEGKGYHLKSVREFYYRECKAADAGQKNGHAASPIQIAKQTIEEAAARKALRDEEVETRELVYRREFNEAMDAANRVVMRELCKTFLDELPPLEEGMSAAEIRKENKLALDRVFEKLPKAIRGME